jgi:cytochrome P450
MEVVSEFSIPVPMTIIADQLGVDRADMGKFKAWSDAFVEPLGNLVTPERHIEIAKLMVEFQHYFANEIKSRRNSEKTYNDILAGLMNAEVEGEAALDMQELLSILSLLLVAGNETTTNTLSSGFLLLCRNPSLLDEIYDDPEKATSFAEEVLRLEAPVQGLFRMATEDTELGGTFIPKGSYVNLRYGSANRDESIFDAAADMDFERKMPRRHLSFGSGIHSCIGAQLARKEIEATFRFISKKMSHIELAVSEDELKYESSFILRGLKKLPVKFVRR